MIRPNQLVRFEPSRLLPPVEGQTLCHEDEVVDSSELAHYDENMLSRRRFITASLALAVTGPSLMGASRKPALRLGLVADPQFADLDPSKTRYYRQSIGKLAKAVEHFN